ncbi:efflux RND transporter periplasmic adaptor subunit [uncultured Paracoccus sp.]|uniref:efflux RND transporter periplasmic adaptor subunit n=1 Tax=uncultured Paracoccus sp. TaxID=189685 RepID=UPI002625BCE5|nr:efflux RND transporter periplasmic adaptor subunit [uncultured Paracoccus sp.]
MSEHRVASPAVESPRAALETDRGASRSFWVASALLAGIVAWMGSGFIIDRETDVGQVAAEAPQPPSVVVRQSAATTVQLSFSAQGQALPERDSEIVTEAAGTVVSLPVRKGQVIERGDVIARLDARRAEAALAQAEEERSRAQRELDNATTLLDRGAGTADRVAQARASLAAAEAQVSSAQETLSNFTIVAPFAGSIEDLLLNDGEYAAAGTSVARIVDSDPVTVAIQIPQQSREWIAPRQAAQVDFITGQSREGVVNFVAEAASPETRTFLAEITIDNADGAIRSGVSAEVTIPTREETAHFVEASVISLSSEGAIGVKAVEDDIVHFHEVEVVRAEVGGVWVSGLPQTARIITVGQGFVREGETVRPQAEEARQPQQASAAPPEVEATR